MRKLSFIFQNLQVKTCTKLEIGKCKSTQVPGALKSKLNHCNFEGRLKEDFQSKFHLMNCDDEMQDIAVISSKVRSLKIPVFSSYSNLITINVL